MLNIVQIALQTSERSAVKGSYVRFLNVYVAILGVVFATIWTSSRRWVEENSNLLGSTWNQNSFSVAGSSRKRTGAALELRSRTQRTEFSDQGASGDGSSIGNRTLDISKQCGSEDFGKEETGELSVGDISK